MALLCTAKVVVMPILTNAAKFFIGLANVSGTPKEKRQRLLQQYVKHLMSSRSSWEKFCARCRRIAAKLESGALDAKQAVSSAAASAADALDVSNVVRADV